MRREMQEIIPKLWLGPYICAKDPAKLAELGITHIVCIRDTNEQHLIRPLFQEQFSYYIIQVSDSPLQNLIPFFSGCSQYIDHAFTQGGSVLVHCNGGISRSPAFVVAYLMEYHNFTFGDAFQIVQNRRFCMNPIEAFKFQLKEFEPLIRARQSSTNNEQPDTSLSRGTRRRHQDEEDDEEM
eukprot:jgi/Hompol1/2774/HPOL_006156-RA